MKRIHAVVRGVAVAVAVISVAAATPVSAAVVFDNFDVGDVFHPEFNYTAVLAQSTPCACAEGAAMVWNTQRMAAQFTVTGASYLLTSITLPIAVNNTGPGEYLRVRLAADAAGAPGTTLEVLSEDQAVWPAFANPFLATTTLTSSTRPLLEDGHSYWIVTEPTTTPAGPSDEVQYQWFMNVGGGNVAILQQQASGALPSDPWTGFSGAGNPAFRVDGDNATAVKAMSWGELKKTYR